MIWSLVATVGGWLVRRAVSGGGASILDTVVGAVNKGMDGNVRLAQIDADTKKVVYTSHTEASTSRQQTKLNWPVFWVLIALQVGPPTFTLWAVALYNVFWWQNGIWPQDWAIAAYPPSVAPWVEMSLNWLYDPLGMPGAVAAAGGAGWLTGKRK
jgi:hypothetical protein